MRARINFSIDVNITDIYNYTEEQLQKNFQELIDEVPADFILRSILKKQRIKKYNIKVNVGSIEALNE